jgi:hypothetical protein
MNVLPAAAAAPGTLMVIRAKRNDRPYRLG